MKYFQIMNGLRGCYMPDDSYQICISTRRELKSVLNSEFESAIDAGYIYGLSQKILAQSAAYIWSGKAKNIYGLTIPYRAAYEKAYHNAFTICEITKTEFKESEESNG